MQINNFLSKTKENMNSKSEEVSGFIKDLKESIKNFEMGNVCSKIQNKIDKLLDKNDKTLDYNVLSYTENYTLLSYNSNGIKCIKIPTAMLPEPVNSRTVFNYNNGEFTIDKIDTRIKNNEWKELQKTAGEEKEGKLYAVDGMGDDYCTLLDLQTGKHITSKTIGFNKGYYMQEGDILIMRDGKPVAYDGELNLKDVQVKQKYEEIQARLKLYKLETNINVYSNEEELRDYYTSGIFRNLVKVPKEESETLVEDDYLFLHNNSIIPNEGATYIVDSVEEGNKYLLNTETAEISKINNKKYENLEVGDFVAYKNGEYEKYNGILNIGNNEILENIRMIVEYIAKPM